MGELSKYVPVSPQRISSIEITSDEISLTLTGASNELVLFYYYANSNVRKAKCVIGPSLQAQLLLSSGKCFSF